MVYIIGFLIAIVVRLWGDLQFLSFLFPPIIRGFYLSRAFIGVRLTYI